MKLQFSCRSDSVCGEARRLLRERVSGMTVTDRCADLEKANQPFEFHFEVCCEADQQPARLEEVLGIACDVSSRFNVVWAIGHQHESHLGFIREGELEPKLLEGLLTSLHVAHSFGGMIVDDELVESEEELGLETDSGHVFPRAEEANWNELLDAEDEFTPFPQWDEGDC
ncbi:MAG: hypothetical protein AAFU85_22435 [Planctomycetota bacterium]